ncbi:MAG: tetratricopeptide repeat protein [Acidobacteriota bacterium]
MPTENVTQTVAESNPPAGLPIWHWLARRVNRHLLIVLILVAFAVFANTIGHDFVYDDHYMIETNRALHDWNYFATVFTDSHSYDLTWINNNADSQDYYRPFTRMLFALAYQAFGLQAQYWHLLNLIIYCAVVVLAYLILMQLSGSRATGVLGALLFTVHPIHSEVVSWVNCLVETLHAFFFLAAFALYLATQQHYNRVYYLGALVLAGGALLSKETALCFPIIIGAYQFCHTPKGVFPRVWAGVRAAIPFLLLVTAYLALRYFAYGGSLRVSSRLQLGYMLLTIPRVIMEYFYMLVWPTRLSIVHNVPIVLSPTDIAFWLPLLLLLAGGIVVWLRAPDRITFALAWLLITMLPVLNIGRFIPDLMLQDRYAFLPSLGFSGAVAMGLAILFERKCRIAFVQPAVATLTVVAMIGLSILSIRQNSFWRSDLTLFTRAIAVNTNSEFAQCNYANALYRIGDRQEAARYYTRAFSQRQGRSACSCLGLGDFYSNQQSYFQAIQFYQQAIDLGEGRKNLSVFTKLAYAYSEGGNINQAIRVLTETLDTNRNFQEGYQLLGSILINTGQINSSVRRHIKTLTENNNNLYPILDPINNQQLKLAFVRLDDEKLSMSRDENQELNYSVCSEFKEPTIGTIYDLDFTMKLVNGQLQVVSSHIHKVNGETYR